MPSLNATLAWATPVDIQALGPNLEAYVKLQPTINMLRLCHRFGGSAAPITRLPVELINSIEDILIQAERLRLREDWRQHYKCFRQDCCPTDHFEEEEIDQFLDDMNDHEFEDMTLNEYLAECDSYFETHYDRMCSWPARVERLGTHADLLKQHFGLSLWTSRVRDDKGGVFPYDPAETTLAYLTLHGASTIKRSARFSQMEIESFDPPTMLEIGCAIDVSKLLSRPGNIDARFKRAMRILGLKPCEEESEKGQILCPNEVPESELRESKGTEKVWPRLLTLVKNEA